MQRSLLAAVSSVALLAGCVISTVKAPTAIPDVQRRAAYDLQCAEAQVSVRELGGNAYSAMGCQREQQYVCEWSSTNQSNTCVRDGDMRSYGPPAPPPAAPPPPAPTSVPPPG